MTDNPLVSICTLTFNHAKFIRQCLDGFLMQEREFGIEILIHDDASTDGTVEILREYEAKYPGLIFPLYESENQYSRGGAGKMDFFNYNRARGKYIACCEGDDYWTDPLKLQKQVDFMEANPEYSVCFHRTRHWNVNEDLWADDDCGALVQDKEGVDIDLHTFFSRWYTQPLSMVFRKSMFSSEWHKQYNYYRDTHEIYHLLKEGKGYLFSFVGGVYVKQCKGVSSLINIKEQYTISYLIAKELFQKSPNEYTAENYSKTLQWLISQKAENKHANRISMSLDLFKINGNFRILIKNLIR